MPKPRALKAPTYEYILALRTELEALYADQDESIRRVRKAAEMTAPVHVPEELRIVDVTVQDPTVADERQRVAASLTINPIKVTCIPASQSDKAQENATLREKFSEEVLRVAGTRLPGSDTLTQAVDACIGDGGGWTKFLLTKDVWEERYGLNLDDFTQPDDEGTPAERKMSAEARYNKATEEAKKAAGPPFTWVCCDSLAVYPVRRAGKLAEIIEVDKRPASSTFREYRLARDKQGDIVPEEYGEGAAESSGATGDVTVIQHWDNVFCFPASTPVRLNTPLQFVMRRFYTGDIIEITTAAGRKLSGTPNHPVLTARGWVALGEVVVGDDVVCDDLSQGVAAVQPDVENMYAPIGKVFDLAAMVGSTVRRASVGVDLNNNGQESDVDVISVDGLLVDWIKAANAQPLDELTFSSPDKAQSDLVRMGFGFEHGATDTGSANLD
ncbi:MAG TPA: Hint domain-containing protein, partial [Coriobacteriia bacterium]|nr:Hint domain-containing protein [Coriobacteriia bacterium]